ncbi:hypothetical protein [Actinomadura roseirufa]|uniref:hypothetical protein n=1 Tax=Actinomadura roseirufa TaxID=2094049 RepID=UPI001041678D|nr:hypothetical protein [Actinomadura roseirufa]
MRTAAQDTGAHPDAHVRLGALTSRLHAYGLHTVLQRRRLTVVNPNRPGCCAASPRPADTITCRPRPDDGGRLWFFTSWGTPITEACHIIDAALTIASTLNGNGHPATHRESTSRPS